MLQFLNSHQLLGCFPCQTWICVKLSRTCTIYTEYATVLILCHALHVRYSCQTICVYTEDINYSTLVAKYHSSINRLCYVCVRLSFAILVILFWRGFPWPSIFGLTNSCTWSVLCSEATRSSRKWGAVADHVTSVVLMILSLLPNLATALICCLRSRSSVRPGNEGTNTRQA